MAQNGYYFIRWMLSSFTALVESMSSVWTVMTTPIDWPDTILGIPIDQTVEIIPLDIMFFGGITSYLVFIIIKFILDIVL